MHLLFVYVLSQTRIEPPWFTAVELLEVISRCSLEKWCSSCIKHAYRHFKSKRLVDGAIERPSAAHLEYSRCNRPALSHAPLVRLSLYFTRIIHT